MFSYLNFEDVFSFDPNCVYDESAIHGIEAHRKTLGGLYVDKVLKLLGIRKPFKLYPPKSNQDLRGLHKSIVESSGPDHHKISVLYYVLLDFDLPTGRRVYSGSFEKSSFLPAKYQIYMKGLWHLDRLDFEMALQYLTHPSLIPTFADEILDVLVRHSTHGDLTLALAYYHTVQPTLSSTRALESLFSAVARTSVTEAFHFSRGQPDYARRHMFGMLISIVLNHPTSKTIADRSMELVNLPLTQEEEEWFEDYLLRGDGRSIWKGKDTLMMFKIGRGKFTESLSVKELHGRSIAGMDWDLAQKGIQDGIGSRLNV